MGNKEKTEGKILRPEFWQEEEQPGKMHVVEVTDRIRQRRFEVKLDEERIGLIEVETTLDKEGWLDFWFQEENGGTKEYIFGVPGDIEDQEWLGGMIIVCIDDYLSFCEEEPEEDE